MLNDHEVDTIRSIRSEVNRIENVLFTIAIDGTINGERRIQLEKLLTSASRLVDRLL